MIISRRKLDLSTGVMQLKMILIIRMTKMIIEMTMMMMEMITEMCTNFLNLKKNDFFPHFYLSL